MFTFHFHQTRATTMELVNDGKEVGLLFMVLKSDTIVLTIDHPLAAFALWLVSSLGNASAKTPAHGDSLAQI